MTMMLPPVLPLYVKAQGYNELARLTLSDLFSFFRQAGPIFSLRTDVDIGLGYLTVLVWFYAKEHVERAKFLMCKVPNESTLEVYDQKLFNETTGDIQQPYCQPIVLSPGSPGSPGLSEDGASIGTESLFDDYALHDLDVTDSEELYSSSSTVLVGHPSKGQASFPSPSERRRQASGDVTSPETTSPQCTQPTTAQTHNDYSEKITRNTHVDASVIFGDMMEITQAVLHNEI